MNDGNSSMMTIDCHAHVFDEATELSANAWTKPKGPASTAQYHAVLENFGMAHAVLAASSIHLDNDYAVSATRKNRAWRTTIIAAPSVPFEILQEFDEAGACGIRLQLRHKPLPDLTEESYRTFLRRIGDLGWHVQLHDDGYRLPETIEAIEDSGASLVVDHFGRPGEAGLEDPGFRAVLESVRRGQTWVKVSAAFRLPDPLMDRSLVEALLDVRGPERLLWGSDWPFVGFEESMSYQKALDDCVRAVPDPAVRAAINDSARAFYFGED